MRTHGTDLRTSLEEKPDPSAEKTEPGSRKLGSPVETKHVFYILIVTEVKLLFVLLWFYSIKSQRSNHGKKLRTHFAGTRTIPEENLDQPAEENGTGKSKVRLPG